jgi:hypothetical protein
MTTWVKQQFSDVAHARRAVLTVAGVIGTLGFVVLIASVIHG